MKREQALLSLSRDHHQALVVAQGLRRGSDPAVSSKLFSEFWGDHGAKHFRIEEEVLLPAWAESGAVDESAVTEMLLDHLWIRTAARRLANQVPAAGQMVELGTRLAAHVRLEERRIFPAIERALSEPQLAALAEAVEEAEAAS